MATLPVTNPTLADIAKRLDPDGKLAMIVEILNQTNEVLTDMPWMEGNLPTGHRSTIRSGLPAPTWRKLYGGVQPTKSTTIPVTDNCGMLEAYAEVDKALADLNGNAMAYRLSEDRAHIEGMSQALASSIFYASEATNPERFTGLAPRYNLVSAQNGEQLINGGGAGSDNTSIWLVVWGEQSVCGIYPKGSQAGLSHRDLGEVTIENADGSNGRMQAYRSHYRWDCGLTVKDWRYVVRICNVQTSALTDNAASGAKLVTLMTRALGRVHNLNAGRAAFYANRDVMTYLDLQMLNANNVNITVEQLGGKRTIMFGGVPVRRCDALLNTEATISFS